MGGAVSSFFNSSKESPEVKRREHTQTSSEDDDFYEYTEVADHHKTVTDQQEQIGDKSSLVQETHREAEKFSKRKDPFASEDSDETVRSSKTVINEIQKGLNNALTDSSL